MSTSPISLAVGDSSKSPVMTASSLTSLESQMRLKDLSCTTASSPTALTSGSPIKTASSPTALTSGSSVKTTSSAVSLTGGTSGGLTGTSSGAANISRGLLDQGTKRSAATAGVLLTPLAAGMTVGAVATVFYGLSNIVKYGKNEKSGKQAVKDTVKGSAGLGLSTTLGVAAAKAVAASSLALGTAVLVPVAAGVAAAYASLKIWHKLFFKEERPSRAK